jgi:hypothetical protein
MKYFWYPAADGNCYIEKKDPTTGDLYKIPSCPQCTQGVQSTTDCNNCTKGQSGCVITFYAEASGDDGDGGFLGQPVSIYIKNYSTGAFEKIGDYLPGAASRYPERVIVGSITITNDYLNPPCLCDMEIWVDNGNMSPPKPGSSTGNNGTGYTCRGQWVRCPTNANGDYQTSKCVAVGSCGDLDPCAGLSNPYPYDPPDCCGCFIAGVMDTTGTGKFKWIYNYVGNNPEYASNPELCAECSFAKNYCYCDEFCYSFTLIDGDRVPCHAALQSGYYNNCNSTCYDGALGGGGGGGTGNGGGGDTNGNGDTTSPKAYPNTTIFQQSSCNSTENTIGSVDDSGVSTQNSSPSGGGFYSSGSGSLVLPANTTT